jgi:hypothetical protein
VRREIVRLVTPGTLLDDEVLEARAPLLLAALAAGEAAKGAAPAAALALLDASTGELRALPAMAWEAALDCSNCGEEYYVTSSLVGLGYPNDPRRVTFRLRRNF